MPLAGSLPCGPDYRLVEGARALGIHLAPREVAALRVYLEEILRWSGRMNLTSLRTPEEIVRGGFLDAFACAPLIPAAARRVLDIGSGAGFPALPLALIRGDLAFTLVEASRKKSTFLRHIARTLALGHVRVWQGRAEVFAVAPAERGAYDVVLARAVAPPLEQARLALPFLAAQGVFLAQWGREVMRDDVRRGLAAIGLMEASEAPTMPTLGKPGRLLVALRRVSVATGPECST